MTECLREEKGLRAGGGGRGGGWPVNCQREEEVERGEEGAEERDAAEEDDSPVERELPDRLVVSEMHGYDNSQLGVEVM